MKSPGINRIRTYLLLFLMIIFQGTAYSAVIRVTTVGNDTYSGATWALAKKTVASAISAASAGDEIWVSKGTYAEHIQISKAVALYGGFKGDETARDQRDQRVNVTALNGSNSGTVVTITAGAGSNARVDGFTITGGRNNYGGGLSIDNSSPTIVNNIIKLNSASVSGGGIFCIDASPSVVFNNILSNASLEDGGGIGCWRNSSPLIANNQILGNVSNYTDEAASISATIGGGAIFTTAAGLDKMPYPTAVASPTIVNNIIAANGGDNGAGIRINDLNGGTATLTNNTIVANSGAGIYWQKEFSNTSVVISNNIVAFNTWGLQQRGSTSFQVRFNDIYGNFLFNEKTDFIALPDQTGVNGNISVDPDFANYRFGNFHLQPDSPCRDAGSSGDVNAGWKDIDGQNRIAGAAVDMGADESDGTVWSVSFPVIHVKPDGNDSLDGLTWATAKKTLNGALYAAASSGWEVWVKGGAEVTYSEHIYLTPFIYLYGGFNGTEVSRDSRNITENPTVIDGGGTKTIVSSLNTGYLVSALDGFTIQNGGVYTAGGGTNPYGVGGYGGGIYINVSSPLIANNVIRWNSLAFDNQLPEPIPASAGGAIYSRLSYAVVSGNTITENEILNYQAGFGAGIYCSFSGLTIWGNTIALNHSRYGSAIYCTAAYPYISGNLIENNAMYNSYPLPLYSGSATGAINLENSSYPFIIEGNLIRQNTAQEGAGITVTAGTAAGSVLNNVITGNIAKDVSTGQLGMGGGIYWEAFYSTDNCNLINNTITSNIASSSYGSVTLNFYTWNKLVVANNIITSNSSGIYSQVSPPHVVSNNDVFNNAQNYIGLPAGTNDISVAPGFVNEVSGNFHLNPTSSCIDAGSNTVVPTWLTNDVEGNARIIDGNADGNAIVDIGAHEYIGPSKPDLIVQSIATYPLKPSPNQTVSVTVTVKNQGSANAGSFRVDFYKSLSSPPVSQQSGDFSCTLSDLAAGETGTCGGIVSYASQGNYSMWAQADTTQQLTESNESNNVFGPQIISVPFTVIPSVSGSGSIICTPNRVDYGGNLTCDIIPAAGYYITDVLIDGEPQSSCLTSYTFTNVTSNHTIAASFAQMLSVRIARTCSAYFVKLQDAYDAAVDGDVIEAWATDFSEEVSFNRNVSIEFKGGYDTGYAGISGMTRIHGMVTVGGVGSGAGKAEIGSLIIK